MLTAHLARCRTTWRRSPNRAHSRHSASAAGTAVYAPHLPFVIPAGLGSFRKFRESVRRVGYALRIHGCVFARLVIMALVRQKSKLSPEAKTLNVHSVIPYRGCMTRM